MQRLLTIAIPTFNRAGLLDEQLAWFARAVEGQEEHCELIVTDNCSTDETPEVIARWEAALADSGLKIHINRHRENVGAIRNIAYGINHASGTFVWTVSDDDRVAPDALRFVLETVRKNPELFVLILNFSSRHWKTGKLKYARCFEIDRDEIAACGKNLVESHLRNPDPSRWGGLVLTTVLVYRTEPAQAALRSWPQGLDNLTCQLYVTAYCALLGQAIMTRDPHVEMAGGRHFFTSDRAMYLRFKVAEVPEAFLKLAELGYSRELCAQKIFNQREELKPRLLWQNISRGPLATLRVLQRYRRCLNRITDCPVTGPQPTATAGSETAA